MDEIRNRKHAEGLEMRTLHKIILIAFTAVSSLSFALDCNERDMRTKDIQSLPGVGYWMQAFGEGFVSYRPPVDLKTLDDIGGRKPNGNKEIALNFITPHQKWGIHSTYTDNLMMLTLKIGRASCRERV